MSKSMINLYVFKMRADGQYTCGCVMAGRSVENVARILATKRDGEEIFVHEGETVGRDYFPVNPSPELAAAMKRAGWTKCYAPRNEERAEAEKHGVPVASS